MDANEGMNLSFEIENRVFVIEKHTKLVSKESKVETFSSNDPEPSKDVNCLFVTNFGLLENRDGCGDFTSEFLSIEKHTNWFQKRVNWKLSYLVIQNYQKILIMSL